MMAALYILSILIMLYYIFKTHKHAVSTLGWKTLSSLCFVLIGVSWCIQGNQDYGKWICIGLVLGMAGDVFLNLPPCDPKRKDLWFLAGLGSFLLGHLAYVYVLYRTDRTTSMIMIVSGAVISFALLMILQKKGIVKLDQMFVPAFMYAIVILFFEFQCFSWLIMEIQPFTILLNAGSLLFVISDLILLFILFGNQNTRKMSCLNLSAYYVAQVCLATTILLF